MSAPTAHYFSPSHVESSEPQKLRWLEAQAGGTQLVLATGAGVFARGGLDAGSRLLIETALANSAYPRNTRICDLGCGWGPIGSFAAKLHPQTKILMCDINERAAHLARLNIERSTLANAQVWCSDGLSSARDNCFDIVLCNPPVRAGNAVIEKLFADAQRCLRQQGVLWVVLRTAQGAKSWRKKLETQFGQCETVAIEGGYRILKSVK